MEEVKEMYSLSLKMLIINEKNHKIIEGVMDKHKKAFYSIKETEDEKAFTNSLLSFLQDVHGNKSYRGKAIINLFKGKFISSSISDGYPYLNIKTN